MQHGLKKFNPRGCDEMICKMLHPMNICTRNLRDGECNKEDCKFQHLQSSKRIQRQPKSKTYVPEREEVQLKAQSVKMRDSLFLDEGNAHGALSQNISQNMMRLSHVEKNMEMLMAMMTKLLTLQQGAYLPKLN
jgi:hypothetical protein